MVLCGVAKDFGVSGGVITHHVLLESGVHTLGEACDAPVRKCQIVVQFIDAAAGTQSVAVPDLRSCEHSRCRGSRLLSPPGAFSTLRPQHHQRREVGDGVAEGAQFPVDDSEYLTRGIEQHVVELVVAVHECCTLLHRDTSGENIEGMVDFGYVANLVDIPLLSPTVELTRNILLASA